jgi:hypothetical protein
MTTAQPDKPQARKRGLVVKELSDEILIYDLEREKAHCLNQTAALVWKNCDGQNDAAAIAGLLQLQLNTPVDQKVVWFALRQLEKDQLLETNVMPPSLIAGMNRRQMMRTLGIATAVAVPLVTSIVAPTAVQAVSCTPSGGICSGSGECCSGLCNNAVCA